MVYPPRPATAVRDAWRETLPGRSSSTGDFRIAHQHLGVRRGAQAGAMAMHSRGRRRSTGSGCVAECPGTGSPGGAGEPARAARNLNRPSSPASSTEHGPVTRRSGRRITDQPRPRLHPCTRPGPAVSFCLRGGDTHLKRLLKRSTSLFLVGPRHLIWSRVCHPTRRQISGNIR